jgi:hypothetical protein
MAAPLLRPFFQRPAKARAMNQIEDDERFQKIGRFVSAVIVTLLFALFAYGYLGHFLFG